MLVGRARGAAAARPSRALLARARLVLANSAGIATRCRALGARRTRVVHLGTDLPGGAASATATDARHRRATWSPASATPTSCARSGCCATAPGAALGGRRRRPGARARCERLAAPSSASRTGRLPGAAPARARVVARAQAGVFVLPSVDEAFGVAYVEAMAGGVPAIGCRGEPGPEEIAARGGGIRLVPPGDPEALAGELARAARRARLAPRARRRPRARPSRRPSRGSAAARDGRGLRGRAAAERPAGPVRHQPRAAVPRRRVRGAARARGRRVRARRRRRPPRRRRERRRLPFPVIRVAQRAVARPRPHRPLPRRDRRDVGPRRAARRLRSGAPRRASRSCCGRRSGRTRARPRTRSPTCRCATSTATPTRSPPTARTSRAYVRRKGPRGPVFEAPQSGRRRVLVAPGRADRRAASKSCLPVAWSGKRASACCSEAWRLGLEPPRRAGLVGDGPIEPGPSPPARLSPARSSPSGGAQLLRGLGRCGRAVGPHARLPRAVGAGRQRSLPPGSPRDRHRRRRRRRRRPRAPRAHRARRARRGRGARSPRAAAPARRPGAAARLGAPPARRSRGYTTRPGRRACRAARSGRRGSVRT